MTYWWMGVAGAAALFVSIVVHEFFHAFVARRYDIRIRGITLFIFGGIAEMENEPPTAKSEFLMAVAGPLASVALGLLAFGALWLDVWSPESATVVRYVATINVALAVFNCVPAFPLDGGRMLRAALWHRRGNLRSATHTASRLGRAFAWVLFAFALYLLYEREFFGAIWLLLIGLFVRNVARSSYRQVVVRETLEGERVRRFVPQDPVVVPPGISVQALVDDYVYRHHHTLFPVGADGRLTGCVTVERVKAIPREQWRDHSVAEITEDCSPAVTIHPEASAFEAVSRMRRSGSSRLLVVEEGRLVGVLAMRDLMGFLAVKAELER